jgi:hypothetical protein
LVRSTPAGIGPAIRQWTGGDAFERLAEDRESWASPRSERFVEFATGPVFTAMLAPMCEAWRVPGVPRVRFETLRHDPAGELDRVIDAIGQKPDRPIEAAVETIADEGEARNPGTPWLVVGGVPEGWKRVLPGEEARRIAAAQAPAFETLGYVCDPDESLTPEMADLNWYKFDAASAHHFADTQVVAAEQARRKGADLAQRLQAYEGIDPAVLAVARRLSTVGRRTPALRSLVRRLRAGRSANGR